MSYSAKSDIALQKAIKQFDKAVIEKAFIGAQHPEAHQSIHDTYHTARLKLEQLVERRALAEPSYTKKDKV